MDTDYTDTFGQILEFVVIVSSFILVSLMAFSCGSSSAFGMNRCSRNEEVETQCSQFHCNCNSCKRQCHSAD